MLLMTNGQKVEMGIQPVDAYGYPAKVDGVPTWGVSDPTIGQIQPAADGLSATFTTLGPVGLVQVNVSADADLGAGMKTISGTLDIQVEAGEAVSLSITAGVPVAR